VLARLSLDARKTPRLAMSSVATGKTGVSSASGECIGRTRHDCRVVCIRDVARGGKFADCATNYVAVLAVARAGIAKVASSEARLPDLATHAGVNCLCDCLLACATKITGRLRGERLNFALRGIS